MGKPKIISLYTGAGGLDYGFEAAGFDTSVALEIDPGACATLRHNRRWELIDKDIHKVASREILERAGLKRKEAALVIGGPPCQPFSKSGYWVTGDSRRMSDPQARTLKAFLRVVEDTLPQAFLLENVRGFLFSGKDEGLKYLLRRIQRINGKTKSNYRPVIRVLDAAAFGVPQRRERVFVVAARDGLQFRFPEPTHGLLTDDEDLGCASAPYRTAWDALADVKPSKSEELEVAGKWADLLPSIPEGQNYLWHTDRGRGRPLFGWRRRYWNFLLKLAKDLPSWTIQAYPGPAVGPFHWENRRLSMRELCRLQTIPDDIEILGTQNAIQRQVGNAVPSLLAEILAREIGIQLLGLKKSRGELRLLPPTRKRIPDPEPVRRLPRKYWGLVGQHKAHPGTGKGPGAKKRKAKRTTRIVA